VAGFGAKNAVLDSILVIPKGPILDRK